MLCNRLCNKMYAFIMQTCLRKAIYHLLPFLFTYAVNVQHISITRGAILIYRRKAIYTFIYLTDYLKAYQISVSSILNYFMQHVTA